MLDAAARAELKAMGARPSPESVIEQARSKNSALHRHFTWDDTKAAHAYRIQQATQILRVVVTVPTRAQHRPNRVIYRETPVRLEKSAPHAQVTSISPLSRLVDEIERTIESFSIFPQCGLLIRQLRIALNSQANTEDRIPTLKARNCMRCRKAFDSSGVGNRLCGLCSAAALSIVDCA